MAAETYVPFRRGFVVARAPDLAALQINIQTLLPIFRQGFMIGQGDLLIAPVPRAFLFPLLGGGGSGLVGDNWCGIGGGLSCGGRGGLEVVDIADGRRVFRGVLKMLHWVCKVVNDFF